MRKTIKRIRALFRALEKHFVNKSAHPFYGNYATVVLENSNFETTDISLGYMIKQTIQSDFTIKAIIVKVFANDCSQLYENARIIDIRTNRILYRFTPGAYRKETDTDARTAWCDFSDQGMFFDIKNYDLKIGVQAKTTISVILFSNDFPEIYNLRN